MNAKDNLKKEYWRNPEEWDLNKDIEINRSISDIEEEFFTLADIMDNCIHDDDKYLMLKRQIYLIGVGGVIDKRIKRMAL